MKLRPTSPTETLSLILATLAAAVPVGGFAQALPRIAALYPAGARQGTTVEVAIRGSVSGAQQVLVDGPGINAVLNQADIKIDPAEQKVFTAKCGMCHELRGPSSISRTADQWVATVDRMIKDRQAPIEAADRTRIVSFLTASARASAGLTARVTVGADAVPGRHEIRVVTSSGTSTVYPFEVTNQPETLEVEPNNSPDKASPVTFPITVNGQLTGADVDCYSFQARKGERLVFNCSAYRISAASQATFFPVLYLYDEKGKELAHNTGYFSLDPLLDWTAPADGKFVIAVRDMLYRGAPANVYRLTMGSLPYKTFLYPVGGRRGESTAVTVGGQNMADTALRVTPAAAPVGAVSTVHTSFGSFPFVTGEYPEYLKQPQKGPQAVTLPVSINGRIDTPKAEDRYTFTVAADKLGTYSFEAFAAEVGSPLRARLLLRDGKGKGVATGVAGQGGVRDPRLDYTFTQPGEYTLEVSDAEDHAGPEYVYRISAGPASPDFDFTIGPDNPNLGPGASVFLAVRQLRRTGVPGDIEITFPNLPPGVTASPAVLRPDLTQTFVVLTAAPDAKPGAFTVTNAVGKAVVNGETITRAAVPYEIFKINNNNLFANRGNMVVSVGPESGWRATIETSGAMLSPESGPMKVTVKLDRRGSDGDIPFAIVGVPQEVQAPRSLLFKKGINELTFTLTPTNNGMFAPRSANQRPGPDRFILAVVNGREGEGMQMCSAAVPVRVQPASTK